MTLHARTGFSTARQSHGGRATALFLTVVLLTACLVLTGCSSVRCEAGPEGPPVRVSQQAAQRLQAHVEQVAASPRPDFVFEMTDEEATSYLSLNLGQTAITEAEVRFLDGKVQLFARVAQILNLPVSTIWTAQVVEGRVRVKIVSASVACVPLPTQLLDPLSDTLNQMIVESQMRVQVTQIKVEPGKATVSGLKTR